jgi:hypothetical protein
MSYEESNLRTHGQVGWMPRLPAAGAGRKADPVTVFTSPGSPALWAGSFAHPSIVVQKAINKFFLRIITGLVYN